MSPDPSVRGLGTTLIQNTNAPHILAIQMDLLKNNNSTTIVHAFLSKFIPGEPNIMATFLNSSSRTTIFMSRGKVSAGNSRHHPKTPDTWHNRRPRYRFYKGVGISQQASWLESQSQWAVKRRFVEMRVKTSI